MPVLAAPRCRRHELAFAPHTPPRFSGVPFLHAVEALAVAREVRRPAEADHFRAEIATVHRAPRYSAAIAVMIHRLAAHLASGDESGERSPGLLTTGTASTSPSWPIPNNCVTSRHSPPHGGRLRGRRECDCPEQLCRAVWVQPNLAPPCGRAGAVSRGAGYCS